MVEKKKKKKKKKKRKGRRDSTASNISDIGGMDVPAEMYDVRKVLLF